MYDISPLSIKSSSKSGFSLIELLVVIVIVGLLAVIVSQIDFNGMGARQKRDRFANAGVSLFRNQITLNSTGKSIKSGTDFIFPTKTLVVLQKDKIYTEYYSGSTVVNTHILLSQPFYGDSKYMLQTGTGIDIAGGSAILSFAPNDALILELQNNKTPVLYYSGATSSGSYISAKVRLGYNPEFINISLDTRNGLIQIEK